jgi:protein-disulfide isomerase
VECDPKGINPQTDLCHQIGVKAYPTWVVNGERVEGVLSLDRLAELSRFQSAPK